MKYAIIGSGDIGTALARTFARKNIEVAPEEVVGVIAFLASEDALFINGVNLPIHGGLHASNGQPNFLSIFG
jgi:glycerol-3-phosphate dehydrogenase